MRIHHLHSPVVVLPFLALCHTTHVVVLAFPLYGRIIPTTKSHVGSSRGCSSFLTVSSSKQEEDDLQEKKIAASQLSSFQTLLDLEQEEQQKQDEEEAVKAATGTVNERLMVELEDAKNKEKFGTRKDGRTRVPLFGGRVKTDEEREAAIAEARDLNGINPVVSIVGSLFAFAVAYGLWVGTNRLGEFFALHPVTNDLYFVERLAAVFRNVIMGLVSLASGFFGVTGMGIFLMGVRVAYGVTTGELDPTPIKKKKTITIASDGTVKKQDDEDVELPNVWDLMMNKKPGRKR